MKTSRSLARKKPDLDQAQEPMGDRTGMENPHFAAVLDVNSAYHSRFSLGISNPGQQARGSQA